MKRKYLLILMFLSCDPYQWESVNRVKYEWRTDFLNTDQVNAEETWLIDQLETYGWPRKDVKRELSEALVIVTKEPIFLYGRQNNGVQDGNKLYVRSNQCVVYSGLSHEMVHWLGFSLYNNADAQHTNTKLWKIGDGGPDMGCISSW